MLDVFWPKHANNTYRGSRIALWLLGLVLLVKVAQSVSIFIDPAAVATSADGIPLATYPTDAAATIAALFVLTSMDRVLMALLGAAVMVRYRSLLPLFLSVLVVQDASKRIILHELMPVARTGSPPGPFVNLGLLALLVLALVLSVRRRTGIDDRAKAPVIASAE